MAQLCVGAPSRFACLVDTHLAACLLRKMAVPAAGSPVSVAARLKNRLAVECFCGSWMCVSCRQQMSWPRDAMLSIVRCLRCAAFQEAPVMQAWERSLCWEPSRLILFLGGADGPAGEP